MAGIYVHIPFCKSRCVYCGFYSTTLHELQGRYVDALIRELNVRRGYLHERVNTIYIGGGTPSILSPYNFRRLCKALMKDNEGVTEFTVECNPDDVNRDLAELLVECGVNRVSMGIQTFSDSRLRFLHRRHNADNIIFAVRALRAAGIDNISIDLMFGFPNETMEDWEHDISKAIRLDVDHISAYSLQYEEGTPLYEMLQDGRVKEIDEELSRRMYEHLIDRLEAADYEHYEISNFARRTYEPEMRSFRSLHNSNYWNATPYLGIGAAAHSYDGESRQWNISDVFGYIDAILNDNCEDAIEEREVLDEATRYNDLITTALRTRDGIDINAFSSVYRLPEDFRSFLTESAKPLIAQELLVIENDKLRLTRRGLFVSDSILAELVKV